MAILKIVSLVLALRSAMCWFARHQGRYPDPEPSTLHQTEAGPGHSRRYKTYRYFTKVENWISVLTFGTLVVYTLVTWRLWVAQLGANAINTAIYEASYRPWLMINKVIPVSFSSDNAAGLDFEAYFAVKNTGHSPAQNVSITADLMVGNDRIRPDIGMMDTCKKGQTGDWVIPGRPIFPDQIDKIQGDLPNSFLALSNTVWKVRADRIRWIYENRLAKGFSKDQAKSWADQAADFPFHAQVYLVGCVNYRSPDNRSLYQTSFMFGIEEKDTNRTFPLLSADNPVDLPSTPMPGDPIGVVVHPREVQRVIAGDRIDLNVPLYGTFAN